MEKDCYNCKKHKTMDCPNSSECYETENKPYYEPTVKIAKENKQFKEDLLNVCGNFTKISLDCIEKQNNELEQLQNEKQQLISFLEEKVKECQEELDNFFMEDEENDFSLEFEIKKEILQEVLDFAEKGGKE